MKFPARVACRDYGGATEKQDAEDDESSHVPLMFPAHRNISLRKSRPGPESQLSVFDAEDPSSPCALPEAYFTVKGAKMLARLTSTGISLTPARNRGCTLRRNLPRNIPYEEILSATLLDKLPVLTRLVRWFRQRKGGLALAVHSFKRHRRRPPQWRYMKLVLISEDPAVARGWVTDINSIIRGVSKARPSRVLALVNPKGGARKAEKVWLKTAQPILALAGVECVMVKTEHANHAHELVANMPLEDLEGFDGVLAVGGDGLFQEIVDGVLELRRGAGPRSAVAEGLRLAQIPAGSTDAVAWSINGTRSAEAAALHVALGDGSSLDVMRVDSGDGRTRHSVCYAAYGYMGDLMRRSERLRWLGPLRYALAGAYTFLRGCSYAVHISYLPAASSGDQRGDDAECMAGCEVCASGVVIAHTHSDFARPAGYAFKGSTIPKEIQMPGVRRKQTGYIMQGVYRSVMAIVTPCRSDLSPAGLSPASHLADGRIRLVLVHKCSQLDYLRFLAAIPKSGVRPGRFGFVDVIDVAALRVTPQGAQSSWNVDGELLRHNAIEAAIHRGLLRTFARGVPA